MTVGINTQAIGKSEERSLFFALSEEKLQLRTAIGMYGLLPVMEGTISVPINTDHGTLLSGLPE